MNPSNSMNMPPAIIVTTLSVLHMFIVAIAIVTGVSTAHAADAIEPPSTDYIKSSLASRLPPYWRITSLAIRATVNEGDALSWVTRHPMLRRRSNSPLSLRCISG